TQDVDTLRRRLVTDVGAQMLLGRRDKVVHEAGWQRLREAENEAREKIAEFIDGRTKESTTTQTVQAAELGWPKRLGKAAIALAVLVGIIWLLLVLVSQADPESVLADVLGGLLGVSIGFLVFTSGLVFKVPTQSKTVAPALEEVEVAQRFAQLVRGDLTALPDNFEKPQGNPSRVLVVVDNIDRLRGEEALRALSSMRALVEIPDSRCVFLVPIDRAALVRHLDKEIPSPSAESDENASQARKTAPSPDVSAGSDFLQKLFALDIQLVDPERYDLVQFAAKTAATLFGDDIEKSEVAYIGQIAASAAGSSPRSVLRILNGAANRRRVLANTVDLDSEDDDEVPAGKAIGLPTLVFVEGLVQQFPELVPQLLSSARSFTDARASIEVAAGHERAVSQIGNARIDVDQPGRLAAYLLTNVDVSLISDDLLTALALRPNRFWRGIANGPEIEEALRAGDDRTLAVVASGEDGQPSLPALRRAIDYLATRTLRHPRDAYNVLNALVPAVLANGGRDWERLQESGLRAVSNADFLQIRALRIETTEAIFANAVPPRSSEAAARLTEVLGDEDLDHDMTRVVEILGALASSTVLTAHLESIRASLAMRSDDETASLFEPGSVRVSLIHGPLAETYARRLAEWQSAGDTAAHLHARTAAERLARASEAGWQDPMNLMAVATQTRSQFAAGGPAGEALATFWRIIDLLVAAKGDVEGVDELAVDLASARWYDAATRLPVRGETARETVRDHTDTWIRDGELDEVTEFVRSRRGNLDRFGSRYVERLAERWTSRAGPNPLALLVEMAPANTLIEIVVGLAHEEMLRKGTDLARALANAKKPDDVDALTKAVADDLTSADPLPSNLGEFINAVRDARRDPSPVVGVVRGRIAAANARSFSAVMATIEQLDASVGTRAPAYISALVDEITPKALALGVATLQHAGLIVRRSNKRKEPSEVLAGAIRRGLESAAEVVSVTSAFHRKLHQSPDVRLALVERAASPSTAELEAGEFLKAAKEWHAPQG
ncbi:MAG: hypothetical protein H0U16_04180, partial [Actinobacteria bacterium]|nr:hypothetical protein [Actinomycetota bacterium]